MRDQAYAQVAHRLNAFCTARTRPVAVTTAPGTTSPDVPLTSSPISNSASPGTITKSGQPYWPRSTWTYWATRIKMPATTSSAPNTKLAWRDRRHSSLSMSCNPIRNRVRALVLTGELKKYSVDEACSVYAVATNGPQRERPEREKTYAKSSARHPRHRGTRSDGRLRRRLLRSAERFGTAEVRWLGGVRAAFRPVRRQPGSPPDLQRLRQQRRIRRLRPPAQPARQQGGAQPLAGGFLGALVGPQDLDLPPAQGNHVPGRHALQR